jgi:hypothetical protein
MAKKQQKDYLGWEWFFYNTGKTNYGMKIIENRSFIHPATKKEVHVMSNGLSYAQDEDNKWYVVI